MKENGKCVQVNYIECNVQKYKYGERAREKKMYTHKLFLFFFS